MSEKKTTLEEIISSLKQERDQIRVRLHLAGMEAKDEYERLSSKTEELLAQYEPLKNAVDETSENVFSALSLAAGEMKNGFSKIWHSLDKEP
jgi:outer membrane murein-binding lipoprotein Lpp